MAKKIHADEDCRVTWEETNGALSYEVEVLDKEDKVIGSFTGLDGTNVACSILFDGMLYDTYKVRIRAVDIAGPGAWSDTFSVVWKKDAKKYVPHNKPPTAVAVVDQSGDPTIEEVEP